MRRVLVLRGGALGDFIVTLPALAALRLQAPKVRIELAGNASAAALAVTRGLIDAVHSQNEARWAMLYERASLHADFASWLASFDVILNFWPDPDADLAHHFPLHPAQTFLSAPAHPTCAPAAVHYFAPMRELGISVPSAFYPLAERTAPTPNCRIAIHPGSGSPQKNWPLERWLELAAWLRSTYHAELLIITGEAESTATRLTLAPLGTAAHQLPLETLIRELSTCRLFIGHDSGISHLAAACSVLSLLFFGPTDPIIWAPPAPHVHWLKSSSAVSSITLASAQTTINSLLAIP
ncbi:MAG: glycosyltransferase family 9 protein [Opitutaceae bacterium]